MIRLRLIMRNRSFMLARASILLLAALALLPGCVRGSVSVEEAKEMMQKGAKLIDVRTPEEFAGGAIEGAVNIPYGEELNRRIGEVPHDVPVIVYCHSGTRSAAAASMLREKGYTNIYDLGAMSRWH